MVPVPVVFVVNYVVNTVYCVNGSFCMKVGLRVEGAKQRANALKQPKHRCRAAPLGQPTPVVIPVPPSAINRTIETTMQQRRLDCCSAKRIGTLVAH